VIHLPLIRRGPLRALIVRVALAMALVTAVVAAVYLDRDGYREANGDHLTLIDCFYYAVVSLSTTGYGDIAPSSDSARLVNILVITPARVLFLIILVGTTLEVLTYQYRENLRISRWRRGLANHVVVCGYGTKGRAAVSALLENGYDKSRIVVVETESSALRQAVTDGLPVVEGNATRSAVLAEADVKNCTTVIIATDTDEASLLITLAVRQLTAGQARIIAAAREQENVTLFKQSGAHHVITSAATAGRLLGLTTTAPPLTDVIEDLLTPGQGMALAMRPAEGTEVHSNPRELPLLVVALIRRGRALPLGGDHARLIESGDLLVYIRDEQPR
jgi:voltage-gated potassium channel